jgi:hypothetical protein
MSIGEIEITTTGAGAPTCPDPECGQPLNYRDPTRRFQEANRYVECRAGHVWQLERPKSAAQEIAEAIGHQRLHPTQARILERLWEPGFTPASPAQMAADFDEPLGNVSYHIQALLADTEPRIKLVGTRPVRGATEHFYTASDSTADRLEPDEITAMQRAREERKRELQQEVDAAIAAGEAPAHLVRRQTNA